MHRKLPRWPNNSSTHEGAIRKTNQCKTPQLIYNGIHTPSLDPTKTIIKPSKTCINLSQHLHSSIISIGKLCDDEFIVTFDKQKVIVSKKKGYHHWRLSGTNKWIMEIPSSSYIPEQQTANILEPHLCNHSRPMAPRPPRAYRPTSQQDLAIFYHQILCWLTKHNLLQSIKDVSFSTWPGLTEKLSSKYLPESDITAKGNLDHQKQQPAAAAVAEAAAAAEANVTPLSTKSGENTSELLLQLFDPT